MASSTDDHHRGAPLPEAAAASAPAAVSASANASAGTVAPPSPHLAMQDSSARRMPPPSAPDSGPPMPRRHKVLSGSSKSRSTSQHGSPISSRDTSPSRRTQTQTHTQPPVALPRPGLRSRKSSADVSPSRAPGLAGASATVPSAAAIQRALSSASTPQLTHQPAAPSQEPSRVPRAVHKAAAASASNSGDSTPHWPVSPRLKSPPPTDTRSRSRRNSLRALSKRPEAASTPAIVVQSSSPAPASRLPVPDDDTADDQDALPLLMKAPSRTSTVNIASRLETVQEASLPTTPAFERLDVGIVAPSTHTRRHADDERNDVTAAKVTEDLSAKHADLSGAETMPAFRSTSAQRPAALSPRASMSSISSVATIKSRTDVSSRNMTVETETVPSIAQPTIGNQDRSASGRVEGSLRLKPSNETIRPRKEKQRPKRKANSINTGTGMSPRAHISYHHHHHHHTSRPDNWVRSAAAPSLGSPASYRSYDDRRPLYVESPPDPEMPKPLSRSTSLLYSYSSTNSAPRKASSKADVFEQQVATAIDEANSSDSDATFIYESNPPDSQPHRSRQHHHSRTPSMTSIASMAGSAIRDGHRNMGKKTSMKFANPYTNQNMEMMMGGSELGDGTVRLGSARAGGSHHHHIGRHGHARGGLNHILVDSDSSLAHSSRGMRGPSSRYASQPNSPRFHNLSVSNGNGGNNSRKHNEFSAYDLDMENEADNERTPLITRSPRARTPRSRNSANLRQADRRHRRRSGWCRRVAGCLVLSILVLVLVFSAVGLIFATTKPLGSVKVAAIQNVIASQEELMLDLVVEAINPNIIGVTVADMDMNIFAKSKHVGSDRWWREHGGRHRDGKESNEEEWPSIISDDMDGDGDGEGEIVELLSLRTSGSNAVAGSGSGNAGGIDEGTDPIAGEPRTMLLGRIFHFDSPLSFDGSFFHRHRVQSLGAMRLSHPGNKTEAGGTERWEEVLQYPFELIVKGVLKYQLPLSTMERKVAVNGTYRYDPDAERRKAVVPGVRRVGGGKKEEEGGVGFVLGWRWRRYARAVVVPTP